MNNRFLIDNYLLCFGLSIILFIFVIYIYKSISKWLYHKGKNINHIVIPDILHNILPNTSSYCKLGDILVIVLCLIFIFGSIMKSESQLLLIWINLITITFICKFITMSVTILPDASKKCENNLNEKFSFGYCNDLIFSGHFAVITLTLLMIYYYNILNMPKLIYILILLLSAFQIISSRNHYTIDVIVGFIISLNVFLLYKNFFENKIL
jgi:membrane-associated phospholipid phosphatase